MASPRINVTLFRVMQEENWRSMDVYADRLFKGLQGISPAGWQIRQTSARRLNWLPNLSVNVQGRELSTRTLQLYLSRALVYTLKAWRVQAEVNHVLDNSYGHLVHFMNPKRTVVTSHGGTPLTWRKWNREGPAMRFFDWAFAGTLKAGRIIIVSEYAKRELLGNYDYDPDRIHVVHHGVDDRFRQRSEEEKRKARKAYLPAGERYLLLHVGSSIARKNLETLLSAVYELRRGGIPVHLLQVGGRFTRDQVAQIEQLRIDNAITQLPPQPNQNLVDLYNAADTFVFPSLYEGFGIPLIEAMVCGTPIVCSDSEVFREVCGEAALFADPHNSSALASAISQVLTDSATATNLRRLGLARATRFTWQRCAHRVLAVYEELAESQVR